MFHAEEFCFHAHFNLGCFLTAFSRLTEDSSLFPYSYNDLLFYFLSCVLYVHFSHPCTDFCILDLDSKPDVTRFHE